MGDILENRRGPRYGEVEPLRCGYRVRTKYEETIQYVPEATPFTTTETDWHEPWRPTYRWATRTARRLVEKRDREDRRRKWMKDNIVRVEPTDG